MCHSLSGFYSTVFDNLPIPLSSNPWLIFTVFARPLLVLVFFVLHRLTPVLIMNSWPARATVMPPRATTTFPLILPLLRERW